MKNISLSFKEQITEDIIALLLSVNEFENPWFIAKDGLPRNPYSKNTYQGINLVSLSIIAHKRGYQLNRWLTFNQVKKLDAYVKKGSKSAPVFYFDNIEVTEDEEVKKIPYIKSYPVFNVADIEGLPEEYYLNSNQPVPTDWQKDELAEEIMACTDAKIQFNLQNSAFYNPETDQIHLPKREFFKGSDHFYSTVFHELVHWTGHKSRLDRLEKNNKKEYCFEELVAELGSAFICLNFGFSLNITNNAAYIKSWLTGLNDDVSFIFKAAAKAQRACNYILDFYKTATEKSVA